MKLLIGYLKPYKWLVALTLLLATINTVFSLIDPIIFGRIIKLSQEINTSQESGNPMTWDIFFKATLTLLLMSR
jgi:ATP-binding cassette subfamily B protein